MLSVNDVFVLTPGNRARHVYHSQFVAVLSSGADSESISERVGFNRKGGDQDHVTSDLSLASAISLSSTHSAGNRYDLNTCVSNSVVCVSLPSAPDHITGLMNTAYGATMLHSDGGCCHSPCC